jgi:hypothetical protein
LSCVNDSDQTGKMNTKAVQKQMMEQHLSNSAIDLRLRTYGIWKWTEVRLRTYGIWTEVT